MISVRSIGEVSYLLSKNMKPLGTAEVSRGGGRVLLFPDDVAPMLSELRELRDEAAKMLGLSR